jgi:type II secretory pathway component PulF
MGEILWFSLLWLLLWFVPILALISLACFLVGLPLRRQERARFFLDLLESGVKEGQSLEAKIVAVAQSRDPSMGVRFHLLAAYLETGCRLRDGLKRVPRFLPPQINAMLRVGEEIGHPLKVIPACRRLLTDGLSQTRGALNYLVVIVFVLTPVAPLIFIMLSAFVFPRLLQILADMEVPLPALTLYASSHGTALAAALISVAAVVYLIAFCYLAGPGGSLHRLGLFRISDRLSYLMPWRRQRLERDFASMLALLLDAGVPEEQSVLMAAESTANSVTVRRAKIVAESLRNGQKLTKAIERLDDSGEFRWRLSNALHLNERFFAALAGWLETLDAKAFQQEQAAAQSITTALVLFNGGVVAMMMIGTFQALIAVIEAGVLW